MATDRMIDNSNYKVDNVYRAINKLNEELTKLYDE